GPGDRCLLYASDRKVTRLGVPDLGVEGEAAPGASRLASTPDGRAVASLDYDTASGVERLTVRDADTLRVLATIRLPTRRDVTDMFLSADAAFLAADCREATNQEEKKVLCCWDVATGQ